MIIQTKDEAEKQQFANLRTSAIRNSIKKID